MLRRTVADIRRRSIFLKYSLSPFRFSLVASHAMKRFASKIGIQRGFRIIDLAVTYQCNLSCQHCSAEALNQDKPVMTLDDYRAIVEQARPLDVLSWNITGGEPLLVPWLDDLIPILKPATHYISIQTNGMLLTEARARQLAKLGVNCITTSVDAVDPEEHNAFRGNPKAHQETFRGIAHARSAGMQVLVAGVVTHQNLRSEKLKRLIEQANAAGAVFLFNLAVPCGNWGDNTDVTLRGTDRAYLLELMDLYPATSTDHEVGRNAVGCPAGMEKIYITPFGDVIPCPFIHVAFGNIRDVPLTEIVSRMQKTSYFGSYQKICLAAEDHDFQKNVLAKARTSPMRAPVPYEEIFAECHGAGT